MFITILLNGFLFNIRTETYSCLVIRYLFLSVMAFVWLTKKYNRYWLFILSLISIAYWVLLEKGILFSTLFPSWNSQQFPSFFYTLLMVLILYNGYTKLQEKQMKAVLEWLGRNSYEIYLMQMLFFYLCSWECIGLPVNRWNSLIIYPIIAILCSILPVLVMKNLASKWKNIYNTLMFN